jgi:outer membrane receptor for ferrienterochelin and colicins
MARLQRQIFLLIIVVQALPLVVVCQYGTISGTVHGPGGPVVAATVFVKGIKKYTLTDTAGNFSFSVIPFGRRVVEVSAAGFITERLQAEVSPAAVPLHVELKENAATIDEVVVSAGMKAVHKAACPIPVEVYSHTYFKKNPAPNIFESLQMINGVQPQLNCNVCNTGDIHINGMEGPYTMILIDGMPIVSSLSTVYGLSGIPNSMVKRIEVVKGPASTLYGSEAVGGLINIITKDVGTADRLKADVFATSIGEYNADISSSFKQKKSSALLGISYFNFLQRRDINNDNFTDITLQQRLSVFNKWSFDNARKLPATLALRYVTENRWGGEIQWQPAFRGTDKVYGESIITNRAELIATVPIKKQWQLDFSYNWHHQDSYYGTVKYLATQQVAFTQLRWNAAYRKHSLLAGIPLRYTFYNDNTPATTGSSGVHTLLPGIFIQDEMQASDKTLLLAGLRYDYNSDHGHIFTPRIGIKYSPGASHTLRLSSGNGYRVVNLFTEDHAALTGARKVVIASALKPEQSWNANINYSTIVKSSIGFLTIDCSAFYTYFTNKIVGDFITDPLKIIYDNLKGYAISKGITLNTDFNFSNGIKINAGATLMDVYTVDVNNEGKQQKQPQLFAPAFSGTFAVSYNWQGAGLLFDFTGRVNGPMYLPVVPDDYRPAQSPWYSILNVQVTKTLGSSFELYAAVKNLLGFVPANPILHADDPFNRPGGKYFDNAGAPRADTNPYGYQFDPSYNYAAVQGVKCLVGFRYILK